MARSEIDGGGVDRHREPDLTAIAGGIWHGATVWREARDRRAVWILSVPGWEPFDFAASRAEALGRLGDMLHPDRP